MKLYLFILILTAFHGAQASSTAQHMNYDRIESELNSSYPSSKIPNQIISTNKAQVISDFLEIAQKYQLIQKSTNLNSFRNKEIYLSALVSCQDSTEIYYFLQEVSNFRTLKRVPLFYISLAEHKSLIQSFSNKEKKTLMLHSDARLCQ